MFVAARTCSNEKVLPPNYIVCITTMAAVPPVPAPDPQFVGPPQKGRGVHGQYVYAIVMVQPTPEVLQRGVKQPSDFDRVSFQELLVQCHPSPYFYGLGVPLARFSSSATITRARCEKVLPTVVGA